MSGDYLGTVYVVPTGCFGPDLAGVLVEEERGVLWNHVSSNMAWLQMDLTMNFDRRFKLGEMFPDGYNVVVVQPETEELPTEIARWFDRAEP